MSKDIRIIPQTSGEVIFSVYGTSEDTGLMLLQRLYILLLSDQSDGYRGGSDSYSLLRFTEGGNIPPDAVLDSILNICCALALRALDDSDRELIQSFYGSSEEGKITCTLTLKDGTTISGALQ